MILDSYNITLYEIKKVAKLKSNNQSRNFLYFTSETSQIPFENTINFIASSGLSLKSFQLDLDNLLTLLTERKLIDQITNFQIICDCKKYYCPPYFIYNFFNLGYSFKDLLYLLENLTKIISNYNPRVLYSGSREYIDIDSIKKSIDSLLPKTTIIVGDATGCDQIVRDIASAKDLQVEIYYADWNIYGERAGMIRNAIMFESGVDSARFFIKNNSKGASNALMLAKKYFVPYHLELL